MSVWYLIYSAKHFFFSLCHSVVCCVGFLVLVQYNVCFYFIVLKILSQQWKPSFLIHSKWSHMIQRTEYTILHLIVLMFSRYTMHSLYIQNSSTVYQGSCLGTKLSKYIVLVVNRCLPVEFLSFCLTKVFLIFMLSCNKSLHVHYQYTI